MWDEAQKDAFLKIKNCLVSEPVLAYFDPTKVVIVSAEASSFGLGGVLLQKHGSVLDRLHIVLGLCQWPKKNYAQIEKECLASV